MNWIILAALSGTMSIDGRLAPQVGRASATGEAISAVELAKVLTDQHDLLTAISLVYRQVPKNPPGQPTGGYSRRFVAASRPGSFLRDNGHGHDRMRWSDDPHRKTLLVTSTESRLLENLNRLVVNLDFKHSGPAPFDIQTEMIFRALCWWPFTDWPPPEIFGRPWSMSSLLREGTYGLRPDKESVGSRPCYVLELKDTDVIWVDCEQPQCVLRRELYNPETRSVAARYEMTGYRNAGDGIWLPGQIRNVQFDSNAHTPALRARVVIDATFLADDIKVNGAVSPGTFRLDLAPGTVQRIVSKGIERFEPMRDGQVDHFRSIQEWSRSYAVRPAGSDARRPNRVWLFTSVGLLGGVLAVLALARLSSTHRTRASREAVLDRSSI